MPALDGKRVTHRSTVAEQVGHRLGNTEHWHQRAGDLLAFDTAVQKLVREPGDADRQIGGERQSLRPMAIQIFGGIWSVRPWNACSATS